MLKSFTFALAAILVGSAAAHAQSRAPAEPSLTNVLKAVDANGQRWLVGGLAWVFEREATHMLAGIAVGQIGGPGKGPSWYKPSQTRYTWSRLAQRLDADGDGAIDVREFPGSEEAFKTLDRDKDGKLTAVDFDWSSNSRLAGASQQARAVFSMIDADKDGQVSAEEWQATMTKLAKGKTYLVQEDLLELLTAAGKPRTRTRSLNEKSALITAYYCGDVGSWFEGPALNGRAPDFTLRTADGKDTITLSDSYGKKPVVLLFGSYT